MRVTNVSGHDGSPIKSAPQTPNYNSAVMVQAVSEGPQLVSRCAEGRYFLGPTIIVFFSV